MSKNSRMKPVFEFRAQLELDTSPSGSTSIFKNSRFFLHVHSEVIEISVETYVEGFGPVGNFVFIEQRDFVSFPIG